MGAPTAAIFGFDSPSLAGAALVVFGREAYPEPLDLIREHEIPGTGPVFPLDPQDGFAISGNSGISERNHLGTAVSAAGDMNGAGFGDVAIGVPTPQGGGLTTGITAVVFGADVSKRVDQLGTDDNNELSGTAERDVLFGALGDDLLIGNGGGDLLNGGPGDDVLAISDPGPFETVRGSRLVGGSGTDILRVDGVETTLDLTPIPHNRLVDIEQVDLNGGGNLFVLDSLAILNTSTESNILTVLGDESNSVRAELPGASVDGTANPGFTTFTLGNATLLVEDTIDMGQLIV